MKTKWLATVVAAALLAVGGGCAALLVGGAVAAAGVGTYAYVNGEMQGSGTVSLDRAYDASLAALKDLEFPVTTKSKDALQAEVTARNSADKRILIKLKRVSDGVTDIRIRVGTFGDESLSQLILDKIKSHLLKAPFAMRVGGGATDCPPLHYNRVRQGAGESSPATPESTRLVFR